MDDAERRRFNAFLKISHVTRVGEIDGVMFD